MFKEQNRRNLYVRGTRDRRGRQGTGHMGPLQAGALLLDFTLIARERVQLKPLQDFKWERAVICRALESTHSQ